MAKNLSKDWELKQRQEDKAAIEKGWLPKKPWKGSLGKKLIGRVILVGWLDTAPATGIIVGKSLFGDKEISVFFPEFGYCNDVDRSQIFNIGEKVNIRVTESNKFTVGFETGIICDMR